ncbi:MAG: hypothetical protein GKR95_18570 [Gammaproteobacteria bacterium]|nr:hypothetical protein [Gammaproteobacteria bacterium]
MASSIFMEVTEIVIVKCRERILVGSHWLTDIALILTDGCLRVGFMVSNDDDSFRVAAEKRLSKIRWLGRLDHGD